MRATRWVLLAAVMAVSCLSTGPAEASDARLEALLPQTNTQPYIEDYFLFTVFPTVAARYNNLVQAGLGTRDVDSPFGDFGDDKSVGVIGAGNNTNYGVFGLFLDQMATSGLPDQYRLNLTWAKQFTSVALGATVLYEKSQIKLDPAKQTPSGGSLPPSPDELGPDANRFSLVGGFKSDIGSSGLLELAASASWLSWEQINGAGVVTQKDAGNISYRITGRIITEVSDQTAITPLFNYSRTDLTQDKDVFETNNPGVTADDSYRTDMNLGVALQTEVNGSDLFLVGIAANYVKVQDFDTGAGAFVESSVWDLPALFMALEFDVYSWLTARVGAAKTLDNGSEGLVGGSTDEETIESTYSFGLGMGIHFSKFDVDATINPDAVFSGGYLLSGDSSFPMARITGTYYF